VNILKRRFKIGSFYKLKGFPVFFKCKGKFFDSYVIKNGKIEASSCDMMLEEFILRRLEMVTPLQKVLYGL